MSDVQLRACRFCGGVAQVVADMSGQRWSAELVVTGLRVACSCGATTQRQSTVGAAVTAWNHGKPVRIQRLFGGN